MMIPRTHGEAQPPSVFDDLVSTSIEKAKRSFNHSHALNSSSMPTFLAVALQELKFTSVKLWQNVVLRLSTFDIWRSSQRTMN